MRGKIDKDRVDQWFGKLTVVERVQTPRGYSKRSAYWLCLCDCGSAATVQTTNLKSGSVKSCGCYREEKVKTSEWKRRRGKSSTVDGCCELLYKSYESNANQLGRAFSLSIEKFKEITSLNCHYCGCGPSQTFKNRSRNPDAIPYAYNGIDRKHNEIGYEEGNCLPCCWDCNRAKGSKSYEEFLVWLDRVAQFRDSTLKI